MLSSPATPDARDAATEASWIARTADAVIEHAKQTGATKLVCASGISPSGNIHLGNLREAMTAHLVAEELLARGLDAVHHHSWDDYDRFRKVPAGLPKQWSEHVGKPLAAVPDPAGEFESFAVRHMTSFTDALTHLGVKMREVRQSVAYPAGTYNAQIRVALDRRGEIFDILETFQTEGRHDAPLEERRAAYYPYKPYCEVCGKDSTEVTGWDGTTLTYTCRCGHSGGHSLADGSHPSGKLVWKVDWPMRWAFEGVQFEPAGEDHHAPTSSFASGRVIIRALYDAEAPSTAVYSFVRPAGGGGKLSSSAGGAATPGTILEILEPPMVRWLYARRLPSNGFTIDLAPSAIVRLYDEWDRYCTKVADGQASSVEAHLHELCVRTHVGEVEQSTRPVSFRLLAALVDITAGNTAQIARLLREQLAAEDSEKNLPETDDALLAELEPRLSNAIRFSEALPENERTVVRTEFNAEAWQGLDAATRDGVALLVDRMGDDWTLPGLTTTVYAVPKLMAGLPADAEPTAELKKQQRAFFKALYQLLVSRDTGPRLPTLLLSLGLDRARTLLTPS
ncbi:lysine--tRNA ligase [Nocardia otitidiscaviarum]|uniref:lysine--tRNA ligase n=1 Tax=Nocardia otitidiscaviarum TaxID=1823 RepID=UPI001894A175|nr:lysine--tRNA ligase [Nocardia otitidiscaviarum]MBF6183385.1 lysine--tRNA ligase [Nocardia otitidiscaviarum]